MTICFKGNGFKYETEAVMKLFLPIENFEFRFEEEPPENEFALIEVNGTEMSVTADYTGKRLCSKKPVSDDCEHDLCVMLYLLMREITGITPEWGCLTGIRPVKKVIAMLDATRNSCSVWSGA